MDTDYKRGEKDTFNFVIAICCGFQNEIGCDTESETYKAYQKIINEIKKHL